ncbi:MAG: hypothetical protein QXF45_02855 [Candidatus Caldarchaeum sp.]
MVFNRDEDWSRVVYGTCGFRLDVCGVVLQKDVEKRSLRDVLKRILLLFRRSGLTVKFFDQTSV